MVLAKQKLLLFVRIKCIKAIYNHLYIYIYLVRETGVNPRSGNQRLF